MLFKVTRKNIRFLVLVFAVVVIFSVLFNLPNFNNFNKFSYTSINANSALDSAFLPNILQNLPTPLVNITNPLPSNITPPIPPSPKIPTTPNNFLKGLHAPKYKIYNIINELNLSDIALNKSISILNSSIMSFNSSISSFTYNFNVMLGNLNDSILLLNSSINRLNSTVTNIGKSLNSSEFSINKSINSSLKTLNDSFNNSFSHLNLVVSNINSTIINELYKELLILNDSNSKSLNYSLSVLSNINASLINELYNYEVSLNYSLNNSLNSSISRLNKLINSSVLNQFDYYSSNLNLSISKLAALISNIKSVNQSSPLILKNNTVFVNDTTKNITEFKEENLPYGIEWSVDYGGINKSSNGNLIYFINLNGKNQEFNVKNVVLGEGSCEVIYSPSPASGSAPIDTITYINFKQSSTVNLSKCVQNFSLFNSKNGVLSYTVNSSYLSTVILVVSTGRTNLPTPKLPTNCLQLQKQNQGYVAFCIENKGNYSVNLNDNNYSYEVARAYVFDGTYYSFSSSSTSSGSGVIGTGLSSEYPLVICAGGGNNIFSARGSYNNQLLTNYSGIFDEFNASSCSMSGGAGSIVALGIATNSSAPSIQSLTTTFSESGLNSGLAWSVDYGGANKTLTGNQIQFTFPIDEELNYSISDVYSSVDNCNITFIPSVSSGSEIVGGSVNVVFTPVESCIKFKSYYTVGSQDNLLKYSIDTKGNSTVLLSFANGGSSVSGFNLPPNCIHLQSRTYTDLYYCMEAPGNYSINLGTSTTSNELAAAYVFNGSDYSIASASSTPGYNYNSGNYYSGFSAGLSNSYPLVFCSMGGSPSSASTQNGSILSTNNAYMWYVVDSSSCGGNNPANNGAASIDAFAVIQNSSAPSIQSLTTTFSESGLNSSATWKVNLNGEILDSTSSTIKFNTLIDQELNYSIPIVNLTANNCTITFTPSISTGSIISGGSVSVKFSYNKVCS